MNLSRSVFVDLVTLLKAFLVLVSSKMSFTSTNPLGWLLILPSFNVFVVRMNDLKFERIWCDKLDFLVNFETIFFFRRQRLCGLRSTSFFGAQCFGSLSTSSAFVLSRA